VSAAPLYRSVLVIGGTSGLGEAVACEYAQSAKTVHLTYHGGRAEAERVSQAVVEAGGNSAVHQLTLPDADVRGTRIRRIMAEIGPCDVVVNCAVTNDPAIATIANAERFKAVLDANVFGAYQVNSICAQAMSATGGGCVINVSSILVRRYIVGAIGYITSKTAVEALTRGFAKEWSPLGVRFVTIAPGPIRDTRLLASVPREAVADIIGKDFETRLIAPERIARVIHQMAQSDCSALNGEVVVVDDGLSL
jgi:NAD(P)-dependent dehydrogenase (short-subunit alcohol dehydrogenase family)